MRGPKSQNPVELVGEAIKTTTFRGLSARPDERGPEPRLVRPRSGHRPAEPPERPVVLVAVMGRAATVLIGGSDWEPVYGGEAVRIDGEVVGRLRSAAFGYTVARTVGTAYVPAGVPEGAAIEVDVFADRVQGQIAADVLVDPTGSRMKG